MRFVDYSDSPCQKCGKPSKWRYHFGDAPEFSDTHYCDDCDKQETRKQRWESKFIRRESEITCPWCGAEFTDSWEYEDDDGNMECPECEKRFAMDIERNPVYVTYRKVEDMPEDWEDEDAT